MLPTASLRPTTRMICEVSCGARSWRNPPTRMLPSRKSFDMTSDGKPLNTMLRSGRSLSGKERNCCFLNTRGSRFANISAAADVDFDDDGRVIAVSDWDHDGDLDFWIANRTGPQVRFLRNDAVHQHHFIAFRLEGVRCNRDAIGSRVIVQLKDGPTLTRALRGGGGYLSQNTKWVHFGLGEQQEIERVTVRWADGSTETIANIEANRRYKVRQGQCQGIAWQPSSRDVELVASKPSKPPKSDKSRIVLLSSLPLPKIEYENKQGSLTELQYNGSCQASQPLGYLVPAVYRRTRRMDFTRRPAVRRGNRRGHD